MTNEPSCKDEPRIGQKNGLVYQWARKGSRPRQPKDQRYDNAYLFGAICPARDTGAAIIMPYADTFAMQAHIEEISRHVSAGSHAIVLLDKAGWHTTDKLVEPANITLMHLPPKSPELNPTENIWQYLRQTWLSNRVFENYTDICDACCDVWNKLIAETSPQSVRATGQPSVGLYEGWYDPILAQTGFVSGPSDCSGSMERRAKTRAPLRAQRPKDFSVSHLPPRHQQYQKRRTSSYKDFWLIVAFQGAKMRQKSGPVKESAEKVVKDIRRATRKQYSAEEKIRIVLDGLRGEHSIAELCRREGIAESLYY